MDKHLSEHLLDPPALAFDMDGTLIDSEELHWQTAMELLRRHRRGGGAEPRMEEWVGWNETIFWEAMRSEYDLAASSAELAALRTDLFLAALEVSPPAWMAGARELLQELEGRGARLALVTSSPRPQLEALARRLGFARWFATLVSGEDDTPRGKPFPDPYLEAARRLGVAPRGCLAVEDSPTGLRAARAAGCFAIAVPSLALAPGELAAADLICSDLHELRNALLAAWS